MKYLKSYNSKIFELKSDLTADEYRDIIEEALSLGFKPFNGPTSYILDIDRNHSLIMANGRQFILTYEITGVFKYLPNLNNLKEEDTNKFINYNPVERYVYLVKDIIKLDKIGFEIDKDEEFQEILTNYLDKGYDLLEKNWGFLNCTIYDNGLINALNKIPTNRVNTIKWRYVLKISCIEKQTIVTIQKDFDVFNHYLKMINLEAELVPKVGTINILIKKINLDK